MIKGTTFKFTTMIRERDLDFQGHVNNAVYMELFEVARWDFITSLGFGAETVKSEMVGPVVLEANIKYKDELINRDEIIIESYSEAEKFGPIVSIHQKIIKNCGKTAAEAIFTMGIMDLKRRKLTKPSHLWVKAIGLEELLGLK